MVFNENEEGYKSVEEILEAIEKEYDKPSERRKCYCNILADIRQEQETRKQAFLALVPDTLKAIVEDWPQNAGEQDEELGDFEDTTSYREKTLRSILRKVGKPNNESDKMYILKAITFTLKSTNAYERWLDAKVYGDNFQKKGDKFNIILPPIKNDKEQLEIHAPQGEEAKRQQEVGKKVIEGGRKGARIASHGSEKSRRKEKVLKRYDEIMAQPHKLPETEVKKQLANEFRISISEPVKIFV